LKFRKLFLSRLRGNRRQLLWVGASAATAWATVVALTSIAISVYADRVAPLMPALPLEMLWVETRTRGLGVLGAASLAIGVDLESQIDDERLAQMADISGVDTVFPAVSASFPVHARGGQRLLGKGLRADLFLTGLDPALVGRDIEPGQPFVATDAYVPVLVSERVLELYNSMVAPALRRPRLSKSWLVGFEFELVLGSSLSGGTPKAEWVQTKTARVVGFSPYASMVGVSVPRAWLEALNRSYEPGRPSPTAGAYVKLHSPKFAARVMNSLEGMGLGVNPTSKSVGQLVALATGFLGVLALVFSLMVVMVAHQSFALLHSVQRRELSLLVVLGATPKNVRMLVASEAALTGAVAGLLGGAVGLGLGWLGLFCVARAAPSTGSLGLLGPELLLLVLAGAALYSVLLPVVSVLPFFRKTASIPGNDAISLSRGSL
jgi:hypothetical protein